MAFVSLQEMRKHTHSKSPTVTFHGNGCGYITKAVYGDGKPSTIEVQIDTTEKSVRLRTGEGLPQNLSGRVGHTFALPKAAQKELIPSGEASIKLDLKRGEDGWWYGSYKSREE